MTSSVLFGLAFGGLLVTALSAIGSKVLHHFSRRDLELYCRRRNQRELFSEILRNHEKVAVAVECLQSVGLAVWLVAGGLWVAARREPSVALIEWLPLLALLAAFALLLLTVTTWIPLAVTPLWAAPFLFHSWPVWRRCSRVLGPLTAGIGAFEAILRRLAGKYDEHFDEEEAFEDEIRTIVSEGRRDGLLEADAQEMIEGVIELGDVDVSQIMTPRSNIDAIDAALPWPDVLTFVIDCRRTRIPVYEQRLDNIVGILYAKDLLPQLANGRGIPGRPLRQLLRTPWFVPMTKPVDDLLREFLRTRNHMAVVVDEYRGVAGVVTIEDALEEIVGEIVDEYDRDEEDDIVSLGDGVSEAQGTAHLDELNERLGIDLPESEEFDTIAGLLMTQLGAVPKEGQTVVSDDVRITVLRATRRRIERVRIERIEEPPGQTAVARSRHDSSPQSS